MTTEDQLKLLNRIDSLEATVKKLVDRATKAEKRADTLDKALKAMQPRMQVTEDQVHKLRHKTVHHSVNLSRLNAKVR